MPKIEYKVITDMPSEDKLNELGDDGWILCATESYLTIRYIFARVKEDE